jgi:hypothetical protein
MVMLSRLNQHNAYLRASSFALSRDEIKYLHVFLSVGNAKDGFALGDFNAHIGYQSNTPNHL